MKSCEFCGNDFEPAFARNAPIQRFCSNECNKRDKAAEARHAVCIAPSCTNVFVRTRPSRKFCSSRCRRRMSRLRKARSSLETPARPMSVCAADDCEDKFLPKGTHHVYCSRRCSDRISFRRRAKNPAVAERRRQRSRDYYWEVRPYRRKTQRQWYRDNREKALARQSEYDQSFIGQWNYQMRRKGWVDVFAVPLSPELVRGAAASIECERPATANLVLGRLRKKAERAAD